MKNDTFKKGLHPRPMPGFEIGYYPPEWLYWDDKEINLAAGTTNADTDVQNI